MNNNINFVSVYCKVALLDYPIEIAQITEQEYYGLKIEKELTNAQKECHQVLTDIFPHLEYNQVLMYFVRHGCQYLKYYIIKDGILQLEDLTANSYVELE